MTDKKSNWQIVFSGVGGQGLVIDGFILGESAGYYENRQATMVMTYGAESRGTFTKADVIVDDEVIDFPEVVAPDVVIALAQVAYDRYADNMKDGSIIIYDSELVSEKNSTAEQYGYPISKIAVGAGGLLSANMVALGVLVGLTGVVKPESVISAIKSRFAEKPGFIQGNIDSFNEGLKCVSTEK